MNYKKIIPILGVVTLLPSMALAAFNTVVMGDSTVSIVLPGNGLSYSVDAATKVESFSVNTDTIDFTLKSESYIKLSSADGSNFRTSGDANCSTFQTTCTGDGSTIIVQCANTDSGHVLTITPFGNCALTPPAPAGGGSFSSGSGGGGSSSAPVSTPITTAPATSTPPTSTTSNVPTAPSNRPPRILTTVQGNGAVTQNNSPVTTQVIPSTVKYIVPRQLARGASGKDVIQLQLKLQTLGFFPGKVVANGVFGPTTFEAVKKFQSANGIKPVNGRVGPLTLATLNKK